MAKLLFLTRDKSDGIYKKLTAYYLKSCAAPIVYGAVKKKFAGPLYIQDNINKKSSSRQYYLFKVINRRKLLGKSL